MRPTVHVAAAAIFGADGRLLISRRPDHLHQGGLLEFPGGKLDAGETVTQALVRELQEELGITPQAFEPLIRIPYDYPDKRVLLDVWRVSRYQGQPQGLERQSLYWLTLDQLDPAEFPAANRPIITALTLPRRYLITGNLVSANSTAMASWLTRLDRALAQGVGLVQLRAHQLDARSYRALAVEALSRCRHYRARLVLNRDPDQVAGIEADGLHLNRHRLKSLTPEQLRRWRQGLLGASCHNAQELAQAQRLGMDYALLSPVLPTASHPGADCLGWAGFAGLVEKAALPVYALGGMAAAMEQTAVSHGGQGIAAISAFWGER